jgi:predicted N-formylglutamate amidohydrolase
MPPATAVNEGGTSRYVLTCEHASNLIPVQYKNLGLPDKELQRHIAYDIGAAMVARELSSLLDAPLFLSGYSRLLIDCNRPVGAPTSIPEISEVTPIPGNISLSAAEKSARAEAFYWPFQKMVAQHLDQRRDQGREAVVIGIHSFTPVFKGFTRPWHAGILFRHSRVLGEAFVAALQEPNLVVSANEPYQIGDTSDYTVPVHGEQRGNEAVLVEVRQDLIADAAGASLWAQRLAAALKTLAA